MRALQHTLQNMRYTANGHTGARWSPDSPTVSEFSTQGISMGHEDPNCAHSSKKRKISFDADAPFLNGHAHLVGYISIDRFYSLRNSCGTQLQQAARLSRPQALQYQRSGARLCLFDRNLRSSHIPYSARPYSSILGMILTLHFGVISVLWAFAGKWRNVDEWTRITRSPSPNFG
jgi:hypothetical protein